MNGRYSLDTHIMTAFFKQESAVVQQVEKAPVVFVSAIVLGELYYGAYYSDRVSENLNRLRSLREDANLLLVDDETATFYGAIKAQLRKKGKPIPENDLWIAALAMQHDLTLVSRDQHFARIDELNWVQW